MSCCSCKEKGNTLDKSDVQLSMESKSSLLWIGFVTRCDWLAKIAPVSRPMRGKAKNQSCLTRTRLPALFLFFYFFAWNSNVFTARLSRTMAYFYDIHVKTTLMNAS